MNTMKAYKIFTDPIICFLFNSLLCCTHLSVAKGQLKHIYIYLKIILEIFMKLKG